MMKGYNIEMTKEKLSVLENIYNAGLQDKKEVNKKLQDNLNRINEIDAFISSIEESEESDFKVFSPRSAESIYRENLEEIKKEKEALEKENQCHYRKLNQLEEQNRNIQLLMQDADFETNFTLTNELKDIGKAEDSYKHLIILDIQEKERQRIARELHDSSLQNLTHLIHSIELSSLFIEQDPIRAKLELAGCIKDLKQIIDEIRETIFNLRPMSFDDLGFKQCIENYIENMKQQFNTFSIQYEIDEIKTGCESGEEKESTTLLLVTIYRIIQESIMNALKHSGGNEVKLTITQEEKKCYICIRDNGKGFSVEDVMKHKDKHFGLPIMKERISLINGKFKVDSKMNMGTKIEIVVPLP